jgi:hypothetical protein
MSFEASGLMGIVFGSVAALMAFLIVYEEYQKHKLGTRRLWKESLSGALAAFLFFLILSIFAGYWLSYVIVRPPGTIG